MDVIFLASAQSDRIQRDKIMAITVKEIEQAVAQLSKDQLAEFRAWYEKFDVESWDRQIEDDIIVGKLDDLAGAAIADHKAGRTKQL